MAFESIIMEQGTDAITLSTTATTNDTSLGGVRIKLVNDSFVEDRTQFQDNPITRDVYGFVSGRFSLQIDGPTSSGIGFIVRKIDRMFANAELYFQRKSTIPTTLTIGNSDVMVPSQIAYTIKSVTALETLQTIQLDVEYQRRAITGTYSTNPNVSSTISSATRRADQVYETRLTESQFVSVDSPLSLQMNMLNQSITFPSGYLLVANQPIIQISGSSFWNTDGSAYNPPSVRLINENVNNPFSTYNGVTDTGLLRVVPTTTAQIITSGIVYGNSSIQAAAFSYPFVRKADIYITYKTTFSGSLFTVQLFGNSDDNGSDVETDPLTLPHSSTPTPLYIGTVESTYPIANSRLSLGIQTNNVSGALIIDRVVIAPSEGLSCSSTFITKLALPSNNPEYPDVANPSGSLTLEVLSNYVPDVDPYALLAYNPSIRVFRDVRASKTPTYRGPIRLFAKQNDFDATTIVANGKIFRTHVLYLSTGSTYDTVSGMRYWVFSDRLNIKSYVNFDTTFIRTARTTVLGL